MSFQPTINQFRLAETFLVISTYLGRTETPLRESLPFSFLCYGTIIFVLTVIISNMKKVMELDLEQWHIPR